MGLLWWKPPPLESVLREQLYDAQRQLLLYESAAEHQTTMAGMYRHRVARLNAQLQATLEPQLEPTLRERSPQ